MRKLGSFECSAVLVQFRLNNMILLAHIYVHICLQFDGDDLNLCDEFDWT